MSLGDCGIITGGDERRPNEPILSSAFVTGVCVNTFCFYVPVLLW